MPCSPDVLDPSFTLTTEEVSELLTMGMAMPEHQRLAARLIECLRDEVFELTAVADNLAFQLGQRFTEPGETA